MRTFAAVKYRLDVVASSPADVVCSIGGWLYDRVRAGWEVSVLLPQPCDSRPLQILGMQASELGAQIPAASTQWPARGLAVSADMFASDLRVRQQVLTALDRWMTEVTLWQDDWPLTVGHRTTTVQHVLSGAARAFKRHALIAAGIADTVGPTETLRSDMKACLPVDSELIPVG
jgi:predicted XRE-type DNA-binding protein